ncbi:MAG: hypothetical protein WD757_03825 [Actinomycetota bacterium]
MQRLGINVNHGGPWEVEPAIRELGGRFRDHMAYGSVSFPGVKPDGWSVLGKLRTPEGEIGGSVAVRFRRQDADILVLPLFVANEEAAAEWLNVELDEFPPYLDELDLGDEQGARKRIAEAEKEIVEATAALEESRRRKRILYLTGEQLELEVVRFLEKELEIPARHVPGNKEDLCLVEAGGETEGRDWAIGEVKAAETSNISRQDVGQLDTHRKEKGLPSDFPAVLIANTYWRGPVLANRDSEIHPDVVRRASEDHIVVVRTLDLIRLLILTNRGDREAVEALVESIRDGGGWFEVDADIRHELHK